MTISAMDAPFVRLNIRVTVVALVWRFLLIGFATGGGMSGLLLETEAVSALQ
ncbi:hypothetical protein [Altererythrobacter sp. ZODW24]|uniref:hypothetical protein n=1 Tax=Altererythrobacter sp. ZODW24 TaxID=2185142 RepID=UPI001F0854C2|nr:hypothetical protein [Altererythrobacter sp. ZODW24]